MTRLCFGTYAKTLQAALQPPIGDNDVVDLVLDYVINTENLLNKNGEAIYLSPKIVSRYLNCQSNILESIRDATSSSKVIQGASGFFLQSVVPCLNPHLVDDLIENIRALISDDDTVAVEKKASLLSKSTDGKVADFLADTFLYALNKQNVHPAGGTDSVDAGSWVSAVSDYQQVKAKWTGITRPENLPVPDELEEYELIYVNALLDAYNDAEGDKGITKENLADYSKYDKDFKRRRKDYYAAETIRRATRDAFEDSDADQFEVLKDETYEGIIDVHADNHPNGYVRLNKVMTQAVSLPITRCLLSQLPEWIGGTEKKGVCHVLVNDRVLEGWVMNDE